MRHYFGKLLALFVLVSSQMMAQWNITETTSISNGIPPSVSCDTDGNAVAVWADQNGSTLLSSFFRNNGWTAPNTIAENTGNPINEVFAYGEGLAAAIWQNQDDLTLHVARTSAEDQMVWTETAEPAPIPAGASFRMAADDTGNIVLIYYDVTEQLVYTMQLAIDATEWSTPQLLDSTPSTAYPIAIDVNGGYAVALHITSTGLIQAYSYTFGTSTSWTAAGSPLTIQDGCTAMDIDINSSHVAAAIFGDYVGVYLPVQAAIFDGDSTTWSDPVVLSTNSNTRLPSIAFDDLQRGMALWAERNPDGSLVFKVAPFLDGVWEPAMTVSETFSDEYFPVNAQLAIDPAGNIQGLWNVSGPDNSLIQVIQKPFGKDWVPVTTLDSQGVLNPYSLLGSPEAIAGLSATFAVWQKLGTNQVILAQDPPGGPDPSNVVTFPPNSPRHFHGRVVKNGHRLLMKWKRSVSNNVVSYEISHDVKGKSEVVALLPATKKHYVWKIRMDSKRLKGRYLIRAVDETGRKSLPHRLQLDQ